MVGREVDFKHRYLNTYFREADVPFVIFDVYDTDDQLHIIDNEVVLTHVASAPKSEKDQIADVIRRIDYMNGDVNHFLNHLAGAIAEKYREQY